MATAIRPTPSKAATPPTTPQSTTPAAPQADTGVQRFAGSVVKIDTAGNEVLSDHLLPGERLRRDATDRYTVVRDNPTPDADKKPATQ